MSLVHAFQDGAFGTDLEKSAMCVMDVQRTQVMSQVRLVGRIGPRGERW